MVLVPGGMGARGDNFNNRSSGLIVIPSGIDVESTDTLGSAGVWGSVCPLGRCTGGFQGAK